MGTWKELKEKTLSPERAAKAQALALRNVIRIDLSELRRRLGKTQAELANRLGKKQASLSQMEAQSDWMLSTLAAYLDGLGAKLRIFVETGDGSMYQLPTVPLPAIEEHARPEKVKRQRTRRPSAA